MDVSTSELARLAGGERSLIEECGYLIAESHAAQVRIRQISYHLFSSCFACSTCRQ